MQPKHFVAFDIGATSGRTILGTFDGTSLQLKELTRFRNGILPVGEHFYWNIFSLYEHLCDGLKAAAAEHVEICSIGIDTWGVDFAFVGEDGSFVGLPYAYRDPHTCGMPDTFFAEIMPREQVYALTGIQIMDFNSLYQLYAMRRDNSSSLAAAHQLLFIPDALSYLLTGKMVTEYTIASTSQLLNPRTRQIEPALMKALGLKPDLFPKLVMPGTPIGRLSPRIAEACGIGTIPVIAVAGHDTASAVAAVPAAGEGFAYLSSGTWSLMGIEVREPIIDNRTICYNFTNEGGVEGTTRLLKNITGMWILEQCLKRWSSQGNSYTYPQLVAMAEEIAPFGAIIDPDDSSFANPDDMPQAIAAYCRRTGQIAPDSHAAIVRTIFESLALKYRYVLDRLRELAPFEIDSLHVIGGGSKNALLNQFTADAIGIPVTAGPCEATAIGNVMMQAKAAGCVGSLQQMRDAIRRGVDTERFEPQHTTAWNEAYTRFLEIAKL